VEYGRISGLTNPLSRLVLGTVSFTVADRALASAILDRFVENGGTAIDTAHVYGQGKSELVVGQWLRESADRAGLTIITKGAHIDRQGNHRVTPEQITDDLLESLERLQIDTVDLYLLHRDDPSVPVGPIVDCLNLHAAEGRIRAFGGSNWSHQRLDEANAYAAANGLRGFVASSPNLALAVPNEPMWTGCISVAGDAGAQQWYRDRQFPLLAWSSQAGGFFSGRFTPGRPKNASMVRVYYQEDNWRRLRRARQLARELGCSPTQIALAWVLSQPFPTFALIGPRSEEELGDCLGALDVRLTPEQVAWLNLDLARRGRGGLT
jgi:1-deoxyxylulose-5-phosphate synthase